MFVCSGLILLKMLSEYVDISKFLPALSSEVVHRVVEMLKLFNMRTCQLVLGAGAMQVSYGSIFILNVYVIIRIVCCNNNVNGLPNILTELFMVVLFAFQ